MYFIFLVMFEEGLPWPVYNRQYFPVTVLVLPPSGDNQLLLFITAYVAS